MGILSIRWRLTLWYGAVLALVLSIFGGAVYLMMRHALTERAGAGLLMESAEVEQEIARAKDAELLSSWLERRFAHHPGFDIQVATPQGEQVFRSERIRDAGLPVPSSPPAPGQTLFVDRDLDRGRFHISNRGVAGPSGPLVVQVAAPLAQNDHELGELLAVLWLAGPLALVSALVGGYFLARRALAPVDRMTAEAGAITAAHLDRRLQVGKHGDELDRLALTLNGMIARLERSFEETRRFTADAAHELRTPLSVIHNAAEVALSSPREADQYRRFLEDILEEEERMKRLTEQLLFLCREDAGLLPELRQPVSLEIARTPGSRANGRARVSERTHTNGGEALSMPGRRRSRRASKVAVQSPGQRDQVYPRGRQGRSTVRVSGWIRRVDRDRHGDRHPLRAHPAHLRAVLSCRPGKKPRGRWDRPGPVHLPDHRGEPWWDNPTGEQRR